jgi:hypothetical protein
MPTYTFKCEKCGTQWDITNIPIEERDDVETFCDCGGRGKRILHNKIRFAFAENPNSVVSTKPDSYWDHAERNRLAGLDRRRQERAEKVFSRDPATVQKLRTRAENQERLGKEGNDQARIQEARELRKLIGDE